MCTMERSRRLRMWRRILGAFEIGMVAGGSADGCLVLLEHRDDRGHATCSDGCKSFPIAIFARIEGCLSGISAATGSSRQYGRAPGIYTSPAAHAEHSHPRPHGRAGGRVSGCVMRRRHNISRKGRKDREENQGAEDIRYDVMSNVFRHLLFN